MADVVLITPWPMFTVFGVDGKPLVGGKLFTYTPGTTIPKAAFLDPGFVTPHGNPIVLDASGQAEVWLKDLYKLRLFDAADVLLWEVDSYEWPTGTAPPEGALVEGSTEGNMAASSGQGVVSVPGLAAAGYRVLGTTWTITDDFGTSQGLTAIALGDSVALDRWGVISTLTAGTTGGQLGFHAGDEPIAAPSGYVLLVSAIGGLFDPNGAIHFQLYWESLPADVP
jgi:hypothetical protein